VRGKKKEEEKKKDNDHNMLLHIYLTEINHAGEKCLKQ
jgi:hypothetical protein